MIFFKNLHWKKKEFVKIKITKNNHFYSHIYKLVKSEIKNGNKLKKRERMHKNWEIDKFEIIINKNTEC